MNMPSRRQRRAGEAGAGLSMVILALLAAAPVVAGPGESAPSSRQRTVLGDVHTDVMYAEYRDGRLGMRTRVGGGNDARFADPADVLVQVYDTDTARIAVPDLPDFAFLGAPGATVWMAPEIQDAA